MLKKNRQTTPSKPPFSKILLFAFILFLPTQLGKHFFMDFSYLSGVRIDYLAPTLYLTDIIALILILKNIRPVLRIFKNKYFQLFLILSGLNILFSLSKPLALNSFLKILEIIFIFIAVRNSKPSPKLILTAFLSGAIIEVVLSSLQISFRHSIQGIFYFLGERYFTLSSPDIAKAVFQGMDFLRPYGTFSHPNSMAGFYLLIHAFILTYKPLNRFPLLKYSTLGFSALLVLITFSKVAILGFFIITTIYAISHRKDINCIFCITSRIIVASALSVIFLMAHGDPASGQKRIDLMQNALVILENHPVFGVGFGNYLISQAQFTIKYPYFFLQPVHNIFLLFLTQAGLILCGYLGFLIWRVRKVFVDNEVLIYCLAVIIFTGLFDHYWLTLQQNFLLLPTILGLSLL